MLRAPDQGFNQSSDSSWGKNAEQLIYIRWMMPPLIGIAVLIGRIVGFDGYAAPILLVAVGSALYNSALSMLVRRSSQHLRHDRPTPPQLALLQISVDYLATFLLIYFTGGCGSPLVVLLVLNVLLAAVHSSSKAAYVVAGLSAGGLWLFWIAERFGRLEPLAISYRGSPLQLADNTVESATLLVVFGAVLFAIAALTRQIDQRQRHRIDGLAQRTRELTQSNQYYERTIRKRAVFTLQLAHNLRAPLGASLSLLDIITDGTLGKVNSRQTAALQRIDQRLRAFLQAIGELLTLGLARDRERELPRVTVDLTELAANIDSTFRSQAEQKGLDFLVVVEAGLPGVESGADLLEKIVENLVSNAIKYTKKGSIEVLFERRNDEQLRIQVRDTGIGIPAAEQDRLFSEFFRASNAKRLTSDGTGLGLALAQQLAEWHGGRLVLASEENVGTTVVVDLPFRNAELRKAVDPSATGQWSTE